MILTNITNLHKTRASPKSFATEKRCGRYYFVETFVAPDSFNAKAVDAFESKMGGSMFWLQESHQWNDFCRNFLVKS